MQRTARIASLACVLALPAIAGTSTPTPQIEDVLTMRVDGTIAVDETGKVIGHTVETQLDPKLRGLVDTAVAQWRFAPPTIAGKPARVKSAMRVTLAGRKVDEGTSVTIDNVYFFNGDKSHAPSHLEAQASAVAEAAKNQRATMKIEKMVHPVAYPRDYHVNGVITLAIRANPDGTVAAVFPTQCSLYFAGGPRLLLARACKRMSEVAANTVKTWKMGVQLNGDPPTPENLTGTLAIEYKVDTDAKRVEATGEPGRWRAEARTAYTRAPWLEEDRFAQRVGTSDVSGAELVPEQSPLQRIEDDAAPRAL
jgi:hypothetical protein